MSKIFSFCMLLAVVCTHIDASRRIRQSNKKPFLDCQDGLSPLRAHFDQSMAQCPHLRTEEFLHKDHRQYEILAQLFVQNFPKVAGGERKIPRRMHQVWIGSKPPQKLLRYAETMRKNHPDYEYTLWTDENITEFELENDPAYQTAPSWGERADILRYKILEKYGGVYCDIDFICLESRSLDPLLRGVDFVAGISNTRGIEIANGLIACTPHHPIMQAMIAQIIPAGSREGKSLDTLRRTGPYLFTDVIFDMVKKNEAGIPIFFPVTYFYPVSSDYQKIAPQIALENYVYPETVCIHLWEGSWWRNLVE